MAISSHDQREFFVLASANMRPAIADGGYPSCANLELFDGEGIWNRGAARRSYTSITPLLWATASRVPSGLHSVFLHLGKLSLVMLAFPIGVE